MNDSYGISLPCSNIEKPSSLDVLLGRGVGVNRHTGNERFRNVVQSKQVSGCIFIFDIVETHLLNYNTCRMNSSTIKDLYAKSTKNEKMAITRSIVQIVRECGGRFLDKNPFTGRWNDVGDKKAIEKTSQVCFSFTPYHSEPLLESVTMHTYFLVVSLRHSVMVQRREQRVSMWLTMAQTFSAPIRRHTFPMKLMPAVP